jgi:hypothetical protein
MSTDGHQRPSQHPADLPEARRLDDELKIREVLARYARGVDRADWGLVRSCYHDDAHENHLGWAGGPDEFIALGRETAKRYVVTTHCVMSQWIQWMGPATAASETYATATRRVREPLRDEIFQVRYLDRFELRASSWRIARRTVVLDWSRVQLVEQADHRPGTIDGVRGEADPSYGLFAGQ